MLQWRKHMQFQKPHENNWDDRSSGFQDEDSPYPYAYNPPPEDSVFAPEPSAVPHPFSSLSSTSTEGGLDDYSNGGGQETYGDSEENLTPSPAPSGPDQPESGQEKTRDSRIKRFFKNLFPWKGDTPGQVAWKLVFLTALIVFLVAATYTTFYYLDTYNNNKLSSSISDLLLDENDPDALADIESQYGIVLPDNINVRLAKLYAENQDTFGWITIPNTKIDYVVVKGKNNSQYLRHDFYGEYAKHGTVFADSSCNLYPISQNTVLYGHHMHDGTMFADLKKYRKLDGYRASPVIDFNTLYEKKQYKVFAVFLTNATYEDDNDYIFNYMVTNFKDDAEFLEFCEQIKMRSILQTDVDIQAGDKLLTLSTCEYDFDNARLVVVAREVREGESTDVDTTKAKINNNARYPQIWYDKRGETNPYISEPKWYPASGGVANDVFTEGEISSAPASSISSATSTVSTITSQGTSSRPPSIDRTEETSSISRKPRPTEPDNGTVSPTQPATDPPTEPPTAPPTEPATEPPTEPQPSETGTTSAETGESAVGTGTAE